MKSHHRIWFAECPTCLAGQLAQVCGCEERRCSSALYACSRAIADLHACMRSYWSSTLCCLWRVLCWFFSQQTRWLQVRCPHCNQVLWMMLKFVGNVLQHDCEQDHDGATNLKLCVQFFSDCSKHPLIRYKKDHNNDEAFVQRELCAWPIWDGLHVQVCSSKSLSSV